MTTVTSGPEICPCFPNQIIRFRGCFRHPFNCTFRPSISSHFPHRSPPEPALFLYLTWIDVVASRLKVAADLDAPSQGLAAVRQMPKWPATLSPALLGLGTYSGRSSNQSFENPTSSLVPESMLSMSCLLLFSYMSSCFLANPYVSDVK